MSRVTTARKGGASAAKLRSRPVTQSAIFTVATLSVMMLGAVGKLILAHHLSPTAFGIFAFAVSLLAFVALFFDFGLFTPVARRIAHAPTAARRELVGAGLVMFLPVGLALCAAILALSYAVEPVFDVRAGAALRAISPLAFVYAFAAASTQIAQGADRVAVASLTALFGQLTFIVALIALATSGAVTPTSALVINSLGLLSGGCLLAVILRPRFARVASHARVLIADVRRWGAQVYLGRVLSIGTYNMDTLMVAALANTRAVGFYVLAGSIAQAAGLPVTGFGQALFARLAGTASIERRWTTAAWALGGTAVAVMFLVARPLIAVLFPPAYAPVASLAVPLMLAQAVRGVTSLYNTYLAAQGLGRELRNCGLVLTTANLVLNFALIPPYGAMGAAWASAGALLVNYLAHLHYYRRVCVHTS